MLSFVSVSSSWGFSWVSSSSRVSTSSMSMSSSSAISVAWGASGSSGSSSGLGFSGLVGFSGLDTPSFFLMKLASLDMVSLENLAILWRRFLGGSSSFSASIFLSLAIVFWACSSGGSWPGWVGSL